LEIYRQYGVSLQVFYIQSMLVEILDFMRVKAIKLNKNKKKYVDL